MFTLALALAAPASTEPPDDLVEQFQADAEAEGLGGLLNVTCAGPSCYGVQTGPDGIVAIVYGNYQAEPVLMVFPNPTPTGTAPASTAPAGPGATSFGDGTWVVGVDVEPGTYRTDVAEGDFGFVGCSWSRLSGFSGESSDDLGSDFVFARGQSS